MPIDVASIDLHYWGVKRAKCVRKSNLYLTVISHLPCLKIVKYDFKKQDWPFELSIGIFGTIEGFYMYWHLGFLIFIFIQEYFDAHVVWHIFLGRPSGKKVVSGHRGPRDARISFRSTSPSIFCRKLNFFDSTFYLKGNF